jgi:nucleoside-diphosphate-sugar epimerase
MVIRSMEVALISALPDSVLITGGACFIGTNLADRLLMLELLDKLAAQTGRRPENSFAPWRPADQRHYVSDTRAFRAATGCDTSIHVDGGQSLLCANDIRERWREPAGAAIAIALAGS